MQEIGFDRFIGIYTRADRGQRPAGAFDTCKNLFFNKIAYKPTLRSGYSASVNGSAVEIGGNVTMSVFTRIFYPATESPSAQDILLIAGQDGSSNKYWFQNPYFDTAGATQAGYLMYGEALGASGSVTINGAPSGSTFVLSSGSATNDYYKYWMVYNATRDHYMFVSAYTGTTKTVTVYGAVPSNWASTDVVKLFRHFHSNEAFSLGMGTPLTWTKPVAVKVGDSIMFSGGQGATVGYKIGWSGYINKTFFSGATPPSFKGTYVDTSELLTSGVSTAHSQAASTVYLQYSPTTYWFVYFVLETDDGQRSQPVLVGAETVNAALKAVTATFNVNIGRLNKRFRYINIFMGSTTDSAATSLAWEQLFYVSQLDMTSTGWTFTDSTTTPCIWSKTATLSNSEWTARAESLSLHLGGYTAANSTTVSCDQMEVLNGRLFVATYYDYAAALSYNDQIRFSTIGGNGAPQYSVLPDVDDFTQSTVESGDPASIQNIKGFESKLFIVKNRSCYFVDTTGDSSGWMLEKISHEVGCDVPYSVTVTPYGIVWIKSGEDVYLWRGGNPVPLTGNWDYHPTDSTLSFRGLTTTYASSWIGWYDPVQKSYRFMYTPDNSAFTTVYEMFFELPIETTYVWTKHVFAHNIKWVAVRSNGNVYSTTGGNSIMLYDSSTDDAGTTIKPYLDTGDYAITETDYAQFRGYFLTSTHVGTPSGTFDVKCYVDGTSVRTDTLDASTNTEHRYRIGLPLTAVSMGSRVRLVVNANATPAFLGTAYTIHGLGFSYSPRRVRGELRVYTK